MKLNAALSHGLHMNAAAPHRDVNIAPSTNLLDSKHPELTFRPAPLERRYQMKNARHILNDSTIGTVRPET
jgi:hypothetical protein